MKVKLKGLTGGGGKKPTPTPQSGKDTSYYDEGEVNKIHSALKAVFGDRATRGVERHDDWTRLGIPEVDRLIDTKHGRGIPLSTCILLSGKSATGKTMLIAMLAHNIINKRKGVAVLEDAEGGFNGEFAEDITGLDIKRLISVKTNIIEEVFQSVDKAVSLREKELALAKKKAGSGPFVNPLKPLGIFVDSYKGLIMAKERDANYLKEAENAAMEQKVKTDSLLAQRRVQSLNREFPKIISRLHDARVTLVIVSHEYDTLGGFTESNTAGGNALKFFPSLHLKFKNMGRLVKTIGGQKYVVGKKIKVIVEKTRFGMPHGEAMIKLSFKRGFLAENDVEE